MGKRSDGTFRKKPPAPSVGQRPAGPMTLILRKTRTQAQIEGLNPDIWGEDDYSIIDGETRVGRIYRERIQGEWRWLWFLQTEPAPPPNQGVAGTLEEAKAEFKRRYAEVRGRTAPDLKAQIAGEIYVALERLGADAELLSIVGSWRDTLTDEEARALLREYNATGRVLHRPQ
jgi:hypothetical protein